MSRDDNSKQIDKELDLSNAGRGVWLVKIPKYIANKWEKAAGMTDVGKLKISKQHGQKAQVSLTLSDAVINLDPHERIPREHRLDVSVVTKQTLGVFSHMIRTLIDSQFVLANSLQFLFSAGKIDDGVIPECEKLFMEGRIVQKLECRPDADPLYMQLKRGKTELSVYFHQDTIALSLFQSR